MTETASSAVASSLDELCINTIRTLAMDAVQKADSGHPGTPMALAPLAYVLFTRHMRHNPADPTWPNRDRFVLSCGHASMLLYSSLYLSGYDLALEDLKQFRQWQSKTPGHPEYGHTAGVETTTGPLGQGLSNAVGMAMAEAHLAAARARRCRSGGRGAGYRCGMRWHLQRKEDACREQHVWRVAEHLLRRTDASRRPAEEGQPLPRRQPGSVGHHRPARLGR